MATQAGIVLYGDSVFLAGIRAELEARTELQLITIQPGGSPAVELIRKCRPAAVLFDLAAAQPDFVVELLRDQPELVLVGVDPSTDKMLVLSGRQERPVSAADLVQVIAGGSAGRAPA